MSLLGRKADGFQDPVCSAFTGKIVNNQLCYEINLNRFRDQVDWEESLQSGLSLVIDTNDEYDVRKLMTEDGNIKTTEEDMLDSYFNKNLQEKFSILLKTISKYSILFSFKSHLLLRSGANNSDQRGKLRADQHQEDLRQPRLPESAPAQHQMSGWPVDG